MDKIIIERKEMNKIPVLQMVKQSLIDQPLTTVIYYHGFNGEKESSLTIAYEMARQGIRVILPDAPEHGERAKSKEPIAHGPVFWEIVLQAVTEVEGLRNYIMKEGYLLDGKLGLGGTSMGGMITYASLSRYNWIKAASVLMGTPYITKRAKHTSGLSVETHRDLLARVKSHDLTENIEALQERPLFIWHGTDDPIVPVQDSRDFYHLAKKDYQIEDNLFYLEEEERIHHVSKLSIKKTAEWFINKL